MSKPVIILITACAWAAGCAYTAYDYVTSMLAQPGFDAYTYSRGFQLLMFGIIRFPFWVVALLVVVSLEAVMLKPSPGRLR
jgi:hypothetical protein